MSHEPRAKEMPNNLDLRWSAEDRQVFVGAEETWRLWHAWLESHQPTPEQVYRKLLLDIFFDYRTTHHLGGDFDTNDAIYEEFNRCTGAPVQSTEDYVGRIVVLLDFQMEHRSSTPRQLAEANVAFIVTGDPENSKGTRDDV